MQATTGENLDAILSKQDAFFASGATRSKEFRLKQLKALYDAIRRHEGRIIDALQADLREDPSESLVCEIGIIYRECSHAIAKLGRWMRRRHTATPIFTWPGRSSFSYQPKGRVLIMGPWNYPFQLVLAPLVGAIAAGDVAVVKPSHLAPSCAALLAEIIREIFPPEYCTIVEGGGDTGRHLLEKRWDHIFFTGSSRVGRSVAAAAATHATPCTLELGGKCPCIVTASAHLKYAAKRIVFGKFLNAGQTCVAPDYLLVHESVHDRMVALLQREIERAYTAAPLDAGRIARVISDGHFSRLVGLLDSSKVVHGGICDARRRIIAPTLMKGVTPDDAVMREEIFGPILPVLSYREWDQAKSIIERHPTPLSLYLFTETAAERRQVMDNLRFGCGCVNDTIIQFANCHLPFGGIGASGYGAYHGFQSFACFSHLKSVLRMTTLFDLPLRYVPRPPLYRWIIRKLMR